MTGSPITDGVDLLADLRVVDLTTGPGRLTAACWPTSVLTWCASTATR